jgi:hypothetical protein
MVKRACGLLKLGANTCGSVILSPSSHGCRTTSLPRCAARWLGPIRVVAVRGAHGKSSRPPLISGRRAACPRRGKPLPVGRAGKHGGDRAAGPLAAGASLSRRRGMKLGLEESSRNVRGMPPTNPAPTSPSTRIHRRCVGARISIVGK